MAILVADLQGNDHDCYPRLSGKSDAHHDGNSIHKAASENAWVFVQVLKHRAGRFLTVISRVNHPSPQHWVVRFCQSIGIPDENVKLVKNKDDKDRYA